MNFSPEIFGQFELVFGCIGVTLGLFFGLYLLFLRNRYAKANIFLAIYLLVFSIRIGKSLFYSYYSISTSFLVIFLGLLLVIGPSLWFYSNFLRRPDYSHKLSFCILHFLPLVGVVCFSPLIPVNDDPGAWVFHFGLFLHGFIYCIVVLFHILKGRNTLYVRRDSAIFKWLVLLTIATMVMFTNYLLIFFLIVPYYPGGALTFSILMILLAVWAFRKPFLFKKQKNRYLNSSLEDVKITEYFNELSKLMENDKLYLDPELTLTKLSAVMDIGPKQLSQIINQVEHQNYSQYIAGHRVEEAKRLLADKKYRDYKIAAIAYESGFNNISTFNAAFKRFTNTTAIQYRQSLKT